MIQILRFRGEQALCNFAFVIIRAHNCIVALIVQPMVFRHVAERGCLALGVLNMCLIVLPMLPGMATQSVDASMDEVSTHNFISIAHGCPRECPA